MAEDAQHRKLEGKVALITGASSGIGAGTAVHFSKLGAKLLLTGRNEENLINTRSQCQTQATYVVGDLTKAEDCQNVIGECVKYFGKLDILVNSAGVFTVGNIEKSSIEEFDQIMNTNVKIAFQMIKFAIPHLIASKGCVVNVSSLYGLRPVPNEVVACVSKGAMDHMTRCVALDYGCKNVRINSVNPSGIPTNVFRDFDDETIAKMLAEKKHLYPLGMRGSVKDVADAAAFLASDESSFITGVTLPVDGGRHLV